MAEKTVPLEDYDVEEFWDRRDGADLYKEGEVFFSHLDGKYFLVVQVEKPLGRYYTARLKEI